MRHPEDASFTRFVAERGDHLARLAYLLTGDRPAAEDLVQDALIAVYRAWPRIGSAGEAEAYARRALSSLAISRWRRLRRRGETTLGSVPDKSATSPEGRLLDELTVWPVIKELSERQRAVIVYRYYLGFTETETAAELGLSVGSVKTHASRALSMMRRKLNSPAVSKE